MSVETSFEPESEVWEKGDTFELREHEEATDIISYLPPEAPKDSVPIKLRVRMNSLTTNDFHSFNKAVNRVRYVAQRIAEVNRELSKEFEVEFESADIDSIAKIDELLEDVTLSLDEQRYLKLRREFLVLENEPGDMDVNIAYILRPSDVDPERPVAVGWNLTDGGKPVPLTEVTLKARGVGVISQLTQKTIRRAFGERDPKAGSGKTKRGSSSGLRARRR